MLFRTFLITLFLFVLTKAGAQSQLEKDIRALHYTVSGFIQKTDKYYKARKPEVILMILEMDSCGRVLNIHLLADKNNFDTTFSILEKIKPVNFVGKKFTSWKDKTVNLSIYSLPGPNNYVENSIIHHSSAFGTRKAVMVRPLYYLPPGPAVQ